MNTLQHPTWCNRQNCAQRMEHRSVPLRANPTGAELVGVSVALVELISNQPGEQLPPVVALTFAYTATEYVEHLVDVGQVAAVCRQTRRLLDELKRAAR